jgi:Putative Flp pilus-assembly TadE/G-like
MDSVKSWIRKLSSHDHRRGQRLASPLLVAYYWDGSVPMAHEIQNISSTGFYLLTNERWQLGTVVTMTLQRTDIEDAKTHPEGYIMVPSKVIRLGTDGVAFEFVPQSDKASSDTNGRTRRSTGRKAMGKFIERLKSDQGHAMIGYIATDLAPKLVVRDSVLVMPRRNAMKRFKDESGQALIITALCMTCLFGFMALAADVGIMLREKRLLQIAADSAAIAGASEVNFSSGTVTSAAQAAATQNGFTSGTNGATVTVNPPPLYGPNAGLPGYVEVIVSQQQPALFMGMFGISSMNPTARAVAFNGGSSYGCVYVLAPTGAGAMTLQGSFTVTAPNCGVVVDSNDSDALHFTGGGGSLTAGSVGVVGGCGGHCSDSTPTPVTGIIPQSDPLGYLTASFPTPTGCVPGGILTGAIAAGCYSGNVTLNNAVLTGLYVFTGNVTLSHSVTTGGAGATLDLNNGSLTETSNTVLNLVAPTDPTNTFHGIAIMAPPTNTSTLTLEFGNSTGTIDGIFYAPGANLFLHDSGGGSSGLSLITDLLVGTLDDQTASLNITSYSQTTAGSPLSKVALVE